MSILALDLSGSPFRWLTPERAAYYVATDKVAWSLGDDGAAFRGGIQRNGRQSVLRVPSIIALARSEGMAKHLGSIPLGQQDNELLFLRDRHLCIYCGNTARRPTREHIVPVSRGGKDVWSNVACACSSCNHAKGAKLPEEAGLSLRFVPYTPSRCEHFILAGRNVLADQMDYLSARLPSHSRLHA